uniref:Glycine zipper domain-containing protein n=1 Tax=Panagrolaimus sp. ES5 TaxID=591445 RepID=A0AC34FWN2_9BILA
MATIESDFLSPNKQDAFYGNCDARYSNINLNQSHKCEDLIFEESETRKLSKNGRKDYGFDDFNHLNGTPKNDYFQSWKKQNISNSLENLYDLEREEQSFKKGTKYTSDKNSSTLSLHIEAYENSIETENVDEKVENYMENESMKGFFVFPPQPREPNEQSFEAEVMKFKASKKLFNPNAPTSEEYDSNYFKANSSKSESSKSGKFKKIFGHGIKGVGNGAKGLFHGTQRFIIKFLAKGAVNIFDKTVKNVKGKAAWAFRLDTPHKGAPTHHININPKISGKPDPHIPISPGQFAAGKKILGGLEKFNKVAVPAAVAVDAILVGHAIYKDVKNGTTRKTVETGVGVAGGWGGGYGGAMAGAVAGSLFCPGPGTLIGAVVGGIAGGIGGNLGAEKLTEVICDKFSYDLEEQKCLGCQKMFKIRLYKGEKNQILCKKCSKLLCF